MEKQNCKKAGIILGVEEIEKWKWPIRFPGLNPFFGRLLRNKWSSTPTFTRVTHCTVTHVNQPCEDVSWSSSKDWCDRRGRLHFCPVARGPPPPGGLFPTSCPGLPRPVRWTLSRCWCSPSPTSPWTGYCALSQSAKHTMLFIFDWHISRYPLVQPTRNQRLNWPIKWLDKPEVRV